MTADAPVLARRNGGAAWLTLNRAEKRNALNDAIVSGLKLELAAADADPEVRVVVLEGAGKDFCAGADLGAMRRLAGESPLTNLEDAQALGELFLQMRRLGKPIVAVVQGRALAGGCGLATACDLILAAESARFGYPEVSIGFVPAMVMAMLRRNVGEKRAFELVCLGGTIPANEAERIGLVNRVHPDAELRARATQLVEELGSRSSSAVQLSKRLLYEQDAMGFEAAIRVGAEVNVIARMTADAQAGMARFADARPEGG